MKDQIESMASQIREGIETSRSLIAQNKSIRLDLIAKIRESKHNIKAGENLCSKLEDAKIDCSYVRADLKTKRSGLENLRANLVGEVINYELELARFRVLHKALDNMGLPFNPNAKRKVV